MPATVNVYELLELLELLEVLDLPGPLPAVPPQPAHHIIKASAYAPVTARVRPLRGLMSRVRIDSNATSVNHHHLPGLGILGAGHRHLGAYDGAGVATLTITALAALPFGVAEAGLTEQLAPAGAPVHVSDTD